MRTVRCPVRIAKVGGVVHLPFQRLLVLWESQLDINIIQLVCRRSNPFLALQFDFKLRRDFAAQLSLPGHPCIRLANLPQWDRMDMIRDFVELDGVIHLWGQKRKTPGIMGERGAISMVTAQATLCRD